MSPSARLGVMLVEHLRELRAHLVFRNVLRERELFEQQAASLIEQTSLPEAEIFVGAKTGDVAEDFRDFEREAALHHFGVEAEPTRPRLHVDGDLRSFERVDDAIGFAAAHDRTKTGLRRGGDGHEETKAI